jgi:hypothetical protein
MAVCCKLPGGASISHYTPNECFVEHLNRFLQLYIKQLKTVSTQMNIFTTVTKQHCTTKLLPNKSLDLKKAPSAVGMKTNNKTVILLPVIQYDWQSQEETIMHQ